MKSVQAWIAISMIVGGLAAASRSHAQDNQDNPQIDLNQFRPSELTTDGFAVSDADGQGHLKFGIQIYMDFARNPLQFRVRGGGVPEFTLDVVHSQLTGHLTWSLGLWDRLVIFMDLPYHFLVKDSLSQTDIDFLNSIGQSQLIPVGSGLGDLYVGARGVLFGDRDRVFQLAVQATLTTNTASATNSEQNYLGEPGRSPHIGGWFEAFGTFNIGKYIRIPLNIGYKTAFATQVPSLDLNGQLTFGGGVQALLGQEQFMLTVESFGRTAAATDSGFGGREETPVEILAGFKFLSEIGFATGLAGTAGVTSGYGNPDWRLIGMIGYTMPDKDVVVIIDTDGDGIPDADDECPNDPEDFDGFQDEDGCPDLDNDADGILDVDDACPNEPGPPENNGCPDPDRDGDGVPDRIDDCPDVPGPPENNGCPEVVIEEGQFTIPEKIFFKFDSAEILEKSHDTLDVIAAAINAHPQIPVIRVEGHTDSSGKASYNMKLSQRRAESVVRYLTTEGGVDKDRLIAEGFGETRPLIPDATTPEQMAENRRVEFHIAEVGPEGPNDVSGER